MHAMFDLGSNCPFNKIMRVNKYKKVVTYKKGTIIQSFGEKQNYLETKVNSYVDIKLMRMDPFLVWYVWLHKACSVIAVTKSNN